MRNFLFTNRWAALGFVGVTVIGAAALVGGGNGSGVLDFASGTIEAQHEDMQAEVAELSRPVVSPPIVIPGEPQDFAADEDLIDEATGMDPTPPDVEADHDPEPLGITSAPDAGPGIPVPIDEGQIIGE